MIKVDFRQANKAGLWNLEFELCYRIAATTSYPETRVSAVYWVLASAISLSIWSAWV